MPKEQKIFVASLGDVKEKKKNFPAEKLFYR
jgi:hypothetical protein